MRDPELQEAVESLLYSLGERTRCAVCFKIKSQGHTQTCRIGKLHAILNSRVDRGVSHPGCSYLAPTGGPCNKCGWSPPAQEKVPDGIRPTTLDPTRSWAEQMNAPSAQKAGRDGPDDETDDSMRDSER